MVQKIIGHESSIKFLESLLSKKIQTFLLVGPEGIGKKTVACWYAKKLICENKLGGDCNCRSCSLFEKHISLDFKFLKIEGKSLKIDQISKLQESCFSHPKISDRKVFLIPKANKMTSRAANSLLKTLEEPPEYVTLFLTSENLNQVLNTIRSRCSVITFNLLHRNEIKEILEQQGYEKNIDLSAQLAFGSVKKAFALLTGDALKIRDQAISFFDNLQSMKVYQLFEVAKDINEMFVDYLHLFLLDILLVQSKSPVKNQDRLEDLERMASNFSKDFLVKSLERVSVLKQSLRYNIDRDLHFSRFLLELKALFSRYAVKCSKSL